MAACCAFNSIKFKSLTIKSNLKSYFAPTVLWFGGISNQDNVDDRHRTAVAFVCQAFDLTRLGVSRCCFATSFHIMLVLYVVWHAGQHTLSHAHDMTIFANFNSRNNMEKARMAQRPNIICLTQQTYCISLY